MGRPDTPDHCHNSGDFAFETTLSGRGYVRLLRRVKKAGFRLHLFYLWIPSPELALLRIRYRVQSGGHNVPEPDVRRRFSRTLGNLFRLYRPLLDTLHFFDNSSDTPRLIFKARRARQPSTTPRFTNGCGRSSCHEETKQTIPHATGYAGPD